MYKHTFLILVFSCVSFLLSAQDSKETKELTVDEYINEFKGIAIQEMERSGIPASITLAQGIHESAFGNSNLAKKAKNHFGIKCTKDWDGGKTYKWDDEAKKSCFRVYLSEEESYVDHTDFLMNRKHYAFLFDFDRNDYKKWAHGLRKAGYATDPKYPDKLIHTIEKYKLAKFDKETGLLTFKPKTPPEIDKIPVFASNDKPRTKPRSFLFRTYKRQMMHDKDGARITYVVSRKGESLLALAKRWGHPYRELLKFNDLKDGDELIDYQPIYLYPKRNSYRGEEAFHKVEKDVTMYEISQKYGIKMSSLLAKNLMKNGEEPKNGELIMLKERAVSKPALRPQNHIDTLPSQYIEDDKETTKVVKKKDVVVVKPVIDVVKRPKPQVIEINTPTYSKRVYADTAKLNTSSSKEKEYLEMVIKPDVYNSNNNSNSTEHKTVVIRRADQNNSPQNNTPPSGDRKPAEPKVDGRKPTEINPFSAKESAEKNAESRRETNKNISNPRVFGDALYGGTKDYNKTKDSNYKEEKKEDRKVEPDQPSEENISNRTNPNENKKEKESTVHVVQPGETLYRLYVKYKVPVKSIQVANGMVGTVINPGERLLIPIN